MIKRTRLASSEAATLIQGKKPPADASGGKLWQSAGDGGPGSKPGQTQTRQTRNNTMLNIALVRKSV